MRGQTELEKEIEHEIYTNRMLVLLETDDGGFQQIRLNKQMFKAVSDACVISKTPPREDGLEMCQMSFGEKILEGGQFDGMRNYYEEDF